MKTGKVHTLLVFLLAISWSTCLHAYDIRIDNGPALGTEPDTFMAKHSPQEGESLISWLGAENVKMIVICTPYINSNQMNFAEEYVQDRFEDAVCVNTQRDAWHYAPLTMGIIYFSNGDKIAFTMYLSGITIGESLFS